MNQNTNQNTSLGTGSMFPLLIKMAVPPMISMLIQSLYNIVDSIFVARLSSDALSAVSIIFPIQNLSLALAVGTGVGLNSYIARNMGAGNQQAADDTPAIGMILTGIHYVILAVLTSLLIPAFVSMYTEDSQILSLIHICTESCIGQTLSCTMSGDEVLQYVQTFSEVGLDGQLDGTAGCISHQTTHAGKLFDLLIRCV